MFVGGFDSTPALTYAAFTPIRTRFPDYESEVFGSQGGYDTLGRVMPNAANLTEAVRSRIRVYDYSESHVVGHSMGGLTASTAFARCGLGMYHEVTSFTDIAGANNGADAAVALGGAYEATGGRAAPYLRDLTGYRGDEAAVRDLAARRSSRAPSGVRVLNVRAVNDELLTGEGTYMKGAENHTVFVAAVEAHGGILDSAEVGVMVERNVRGGPQRNGVGEVVVGWLSDRRDDLRDVLLGSARAVLDRPHVLAYWTAALGVIGFTWFQATFRFP